MRPARNPAISHLSRKHKSPLPAPAWTESLIPCALLSTWSRCSGAPYRTARLAAALTVSPTVSPKFSQQHANSAHRKNRQRLAGYVAFGGAPQRRRSPVGEGPTQGGCWLNLIACERPSRETGQGEASR